jgi:hypothetical protein
MKVQQQQGSGFWGAVSIVAATLALSLGIGATIFSPPAIARASLGSLLPVMGCTGANSLANLLQQDSPTIDRVAGAPMRLVSAAVVTAPPLPAGSPPFQQGTYCDLVVYVAPHVQVEVRLPQDGWTQRFVMAGCGSYCGALAASFSFNRAAWNCPVLQTGETVVANTDLGHTRAGGLANPGADGVWAQGSPDEIIDFAYTGMHKATLAAKALIKAFYGQPQKYSYFQGCSDGGREGLHEAQRYPDDYDGYVVGAPVIDEVATNTFYHAWNVRMNNRADGTAILTSDKIPALHQAVLNACGKLNGGVGDMLQDFRACSFDALSIICPGADAPTCLTAEQAYAANLIYLGPVDQDGNHLSAGDMPYGSELSWIAGITPAPGVIRNLQNSGEFQFAYDFPNYMTRFDGPTGITNQNIQFTETQFDSLMPLAGIWDSTNPDLRAFAEKGKKLLLWQGWADGGASPRMVLNYYHAVRSIVGSSAADSFMKLFMIPGVYHCDGSSGPVPPTNATVGIGHQDFLTPMMDWVESGEVPTMVLASYLGNSAGLNDFTTPVVATRPVFAYPFIALYVGPGGSDINSPNNFVAGLPPAQFSDVYEWLGLDHYDPGFPMSCSSKNSATKATFTCTSPGGGNDNGER